MMNYEARTGDYLDALDCFIKVGGQFFPSTSSDGANTILCGRTCITYWKEGSAVRANVRNAARKFGFPPDNMTAGRLAKAIFRDIMGLETKATPYGDKACKMAKTGKHWHYQYVETGYHPFLIEFDLKSAYFTSLFHGKSLLWDENKGWLDDGGALEVLKQITPDLPKWLRLVMLGVLSSHKQKFYTVKVKANGDRYLKLATLNKISYGAAFNCAHKAVNRTYQCMSKIHQMGGVDIKRMHTDSFALAVSCSGDVESKIMQFLSDNDYKVAVKGYGSSHFLNLNEGLIGKKLVGVKESVFSQFREANIKIPNVDLTDEERARWEGYIKPDIKHEYDKPVQEKALEDVLQMSLGLGLSF